MTLRRDRRSVEPVRRGVNRFEFRRATDENAIPPKHSDEILVGRRVAVETAIDGARETAVTMIFFLDRKYIGIGRESRKTI